MLENTDKIPQNAERRTQNAEPLFAHLKAEIKKHPIIYCPARFVKRIVVDFPLSIKLFIKWQIYKHTVKFNRNSLNTTEQRQRKIIASLTSYPARINVVPYVIASLLNQTMKPDKIILWLGNQHFPDEKLPPIFDELKLCGVDVNFREDLRAHTKYFHAVREYPEDIVITFDDDIVYQPHIIETLYKSYLEHPECVSAMRTHKITFLPDGNIAPYASWKWEYSGAKGQESHIWLATGVGGVLYPPKCLPAETFNTEAVKKLCLRADDVWLKFMELMNGTKVVPASDNGRLQGFGVPVSQKLALFVDNVSNGGNDTQVSAVLEAYSDWRDPDGKTLLELIRDN